MAASLIEQETPTRESVLQQLRAIYPHVADEYGVSRIGLFGSVARGAADAGSDIDLIVEFRQPIGLKFIELVGYLERALGRKVDVVTPAGLQTVRVSGVTKNIADDVVYV